MKSMKLGLIGMMLVVGAMAKAETHVTFVCMNLSDEMHGSPSDRLFISTDGTQLTYQMEHCSLEIRNHCYGGDGTYTSSGSLTQISDTDYAGDANLTLQNGLYTFADRDGHIAKFVEAACKAVEP